MFLLESFQERLIRQAPHNGIFEEAAEKCGAIPHLVPGIPRGRDRTGLAP